MMTWWALRLTTLLATVLAIALTAQPAAASDSRHTTDLAVQKVSFRQWESAPEDKCRGSKCVHRSAGVIHQTVGYNIVNEGLVASGPFEVHVRIDGEDFPSWHLYNDGLRGGGLVSSTFDMEHIGGLRAGEHEVQVFIRLIRDPDAEFTPIPIDGCPGDESLAERIVVPAVL